MMEDAVLKIGEENTGVYLVSMNEGKEGSSDSIALGFVVRELEEGSDRYSLGYFDIGGRMCALKGSCHISEAGDALYFEVDEDLTLVFRYLDLSLKDRVVSMIRVNTKQDEFMKLQTTEEVQEFFMG